MEIKPLYKRTIYMLFATSGFCALVYEILWTKYLSLTFGTTMFAVSIVAATFMGGIALGSYLLGRFADRQTNLLRIYAYLEIGIVLTALLFIPTLKCVEWIYIALTRSFPDYPEVNHIIRFFFSAMLLMPPTVCMGGTFPLMCRFFARKKSGGQIGRLYAMNTLGAMLGALSAGYLLIPTFGLSSTNYFAIFCNLSIAAVTLLLSGNIGITAPHDTSEAKRPEQQTLIKNNQLILCSIFFIGLFSLAYEILWTRVFLLFLGNTSFAFSLMLSAYLIGIAFGGALYAKLARPAMNERRIFAILTVLMGLSLLATIPFYDQLAHLIQSSHEASGGRWWYLSFLSFLIIFLVMAIPTTFSGCLLPATVAIIDPGQVRTGEGVGLVVLYNTIGAVFGSLIAGFFLIPELGVQLSFKLFATINVILGLILWYRYGKKIKYRPAITAVAACTVALTVLPGKWDDKLMNSAVYCYAPKYEKWGGIENTLKGERILKVIEGVDTTVAVKEYADGSVRYFSVNGKTDGGNGTDMATQVLIGQLPMLLHPHPEDVLVIGLGTGITLGGVKEHQVKKIDCVEISAGVVEASGWFERSNRSALKSPSVNLIIEDGRNLLLTTEKKYDLIISEPSNPWQVGNANIFTSDFYQLAADRLKDNGLFCQWVGLYDITPENLRIAVNTILKTFPKVLAFTSKSDMILIGANHEQKLDYANIERKMAQPKIRAIFQEIGISTAAELIAQHYMFSEKTLRNFSRGAAVNSDDFPILEYSFRHLLGGKMLGTLLQDNVLAMFSANPGEKVPLVNLGRTNVEIANVFRDLGSFCSKAGRQQEARYFLTQAQRMENL